MYDTVHPGSLDGDRYQDSSLIGCFFRASGSNGWRHPVDVRTFATVRSSTLLNSCASFASNSRASADAGSTDSIGSTERLPLMAMPSFGYGRTDPGAGSAGV